MKYKILVCGSGEFIYRGVESFMLNIYRNIDHNIIDMDFFTPDDCKNDFFFKLSKLYGGKVIEAHSPHGKVHRGLYLIKNLKKLLKNEHYDAVHINSGNIQAITAIMFAAYLAKVPCRIAHANNCGLNNIKYWITKMICFPFIKLSVTDYISCSKFSSQYVFPKSVQDRINYIPNGIDVHKFIYDENVREELRRQYGLKDEVVIGHVGAFVEQKNHVFLLNIFKDLLRENDKYILMLHGDGNNTKYKKIANEFGIEDKIMFMGKSDSIEKWMSVYDLFVLPSLYEGYPTVSMEAQVSGLKCLLSDTITPEVKFSDEVEFLPINKGTRCWVDKILSVKKEDRKLSKTSPIYSADLVAVANQMQEYYINMISVQR